VTVSDMLYLLHYMCVCVCVRCNLLHCLSMCVSVWGAVMLYGRVSAACMCVCYVFEVRCLKPAGCFIVPGK